MRKLETFDHSEDKKISTTSATFGLLRKELIENLGVRRAKSFLLRYGWNLGKAHAKDVLKGGGSVEQMLEKAGALHYETGQISGLVSERHVKLDEHGEVASISASGEWLDSFEVAEHVKNHGISDCPVCHTLTGFGSGFTSTITGRSIFIREVECRGKGDASCRFEMKLEEDWDDVEMKEEIQLYQESRFIDELNYTYEQLLEQKNFIEKASTFHDTLTSRLSDGDSIEEMIGTIYDTLNIPVSIEDLNFHPRVYRGIDEIQYNTFSEDFLNSINKTKSGKILYSSYDKTFVVQGKSHKRLVTPIIVQKKPIGYITFFYLDKDAEAEKETMFIQRAATSAALFFLNEKTSLEAVENIKAYFFEQLLLKQYSSIPSIVYRGYYMGIDLKEPFFIASLKCTSEHLDASKVELLDQIIHSITRYLEMQSYKILITEYEGSIVMLLPKVDRLNYMLDNILKHLSHEHRHLAFQVGMSSQHDTIETIEEGLEESRVALRLNKGDKIASFEEVSIIGSLINSKNMLTIRRIAKKELNPILELKEHKRDELLNTLYVFLLNGGNLQQSISDLSLSMSGLMYRISRIEKLLNKELRNPAVAYELLLMLDALRILGDIDV
ncbi:helix-turn-helix domain-containing protein [Planococcus sp. N028]|uniref:Helix-turn-helix domain-containing protein n=1 Tax=Planococcus shixiaomingii TaxID=3058393 RepID=A0ABT8MZ53_9BACL|nr:V4R domain-containing protein [Planococcus sp. N028]MDN7240912.1 helix-turn-helix domain-containing protein [Planococcus sp. N028]